MSVALAVRGRRASSSSPSDVGRQLDHLDRARRDRPGVSPSPRPPRRGTAAAAASSSASRAAQRAVGVAPRRRASRRRARRSATRRPRARARRRSTTASHSRVRGTPWMPVSPQPGGVVGRRRRVEPALAREPLVQRLAPEEPPLTRLDQAVVAVAAPVDDVDLIRLELRKTKKSWPISSSCEHGLLGAHRLQRELLRLHDQRLVLRRAEPSAGVPFERPCRSCSWRAALLAGSASPGVRACRRAGRSTPSCRSTPPGRAAPAPSSRRSPRRRGCRRSTGSSRPPARARRCVGSRELPVELRRASPRRSPDRVADLDVLALDLQAASRPPSSGRSGPIASNLTAAGRVAREGHHLDPRRAGARGAPTRPRDAVAPVV